MTEMEVKLRKHEVLRRTTTKKNQFDEAIKQGKFFKGVPVFEGGRVLARFGDGVDACIDTRRQARDAAVAAAPKIEDDAPPARVRAAASKAKPITAKRQPWGRGR
jgi:hypothetical protein